MNIAWQLEFMNSSQLCGAFAKLLLIGFSFSFNVDHGSLYNFISKEVSFYY